MGADASIFQLLNQQKPAPGPLDNYGQMMSIKQLMGSNELQDLHRAKLTRDFSEEDATNQAFRDSGGDLVKARDLLYGRGLAKPALAIEDRRLKAEQSQATLAHTKAQTGEITAGHIATGMAAVLKGNGSDESIAQLAQTMTDAGMPADKVQAAAGRLLALPPEQRVTAALAGAVQHKNGIEALKLMFPAAHMQDTGSSHVPVTTSTLPGGPAPGSLVPGGVAIPKTQSPDSVATDRRVESEGKLNRASHEGIARMNDDRQREMNGILEGQQGVDLTPTATAIANHDLPMPNPPSGSRNPMAMTNYNKLVTAVKGINPGYNAIDYQVSQKAMRDFGTGKQGQEAQSANTAVNHLDTLEKLAKAQKNGDIQLFNRVANEFAAQTGGTAPTNLKAALTMVGPEISKAVIGAGGGVEDRNKVHAALNPNYSPDQFLGATGGMKELFAGRLSEAERTYERTTMRKDFRDKILSPATREVLNTRGTAPTGTQTAAPAQPKKGAKVDGYTYTGGDPANPANWKKDQ